MNEYINAQVMQMRAYIGQWEMSCYMAAKRNDGILDKEEAKQLKRISAAVKSFAKDLDRIAIDQEMER